MYIPCLLIDTLLLSLQWSCISASDTLMHTLQVNIPASLADGYVSIRPAVEFTSIPFLVSWMTGEPTRLLTTSAMHMNEFKSLEKFTFRHLLSPLPALELTVSSTPGRGRPAGRELHHYTSLTICHNLLFTVTEYVSVAVASTMKSVVCSGVMTALHV